MRNLHYQFKISCCTISLIIQEILSAIVTHLKDDYLVKRNTQISPFAILLENEFKLLAVKFKILSSNIHLQPCKVELIVSSCICLYNLLIKDNNITIPLQDDYFQDDYCEISPYLVLPFGMVDNFQIYKRLLNK